MIYSTIFLFASTFREDLPTGLGLCILPFILGWLFAYVFHNVTGLQKQVADLTTDKTSLTERVHKIESEMTDLRMKLIETEAERDSKANQVSKLKNDLMLVESERNMLREKAEKPKK